LGNSSSQSLIQLDAHTLEFYVRLITILIHFVLVFLSLRSLLDILHLFHISPLSLWG
jgi:hypothetical protein